ncbi:hypothetical protein KVR01_007340 [Diaporthe batatas]|uniref:uncharacterized protein n=1 Tax=Diaporthe batatas TaxID=748121 RepID=UPI001D05730E|nr:uncharacterized protein KVR01_007340 [Diaporthe batatas]KAG8162862.1 hypothetical protein KVR01_007340 [Diaporthe batatas]
MTKALFLASALAAGTIAQTTSVVGVFLNTYEVGNITLQGSVISAAPDATTYSITRVDDATCTQDCTDDPQQTGLTDDLQMTFVNGPSTFAHHLIKPGQYTIDYECKVSDGTNADCEGTSSGPSVVPGRQIEAMVWASTSLTPVTITAGLEKILAVSTATAGTAQTAASASSGASQTGASASATSSDSAPGASTTASSAAAGAGHNIVLGVVCGILFVMLGL